MTDDRPQPRYGQYAPGPPPAPVVVAPPEPEPEVAPPVKRRTWDVALTTTLLLLGTWDVVASFATYSDFGGTIATVFAQQGLDDFTAYALAAQLGLVLNVLRVALLVLATLIALVRIGRNRIAFWAPLGAGVLAVLATVVCMFVVFASDPAFIRYVESMLAQ